MTVDEQLRETLHRRADVVEPSLGGWSAITRRIERQQRRTRTTTFSLVAGFSLAAVAVAVLMVTLAVPDASEQDVAATGGSAEVRVSTSVAYPFTPTTTATGSEATPGPGQVATPPPSRGTEGSSASTAVIASGAPGQIDTGTLSFGMPSRTIYPETAAELEAVQDQVDAGHQPWWLDPAMVASSYLSNRGLTTTEAGAPRYLGDPGALRYTTTGGVGGWVNASTLLNGSVYYVTDTRSDRIVSLRIVRQGDRLAVDVLPSDSGKVVVRTKRPGTAWNPSTTQTVVGGRLASLTVEGPASTELIVQVRHEGDDGQVGLAENRLEREQARLEYEGLHDGSVLHPAGLGPVSIGLDGAWTQQMAGIAMTTDVSGTCTSLSPAGRPEGVSFVSTDGDDLSDMIIVAAPSVRTEEGIGVGSTVADVRRAYPTVEERLVDGSGRLVYPAPPPSERFEMVFGIVDGEVATIWSGPQGLSLTDEICA